MLLVDGRLLLVSGRLGCLRRGGRVGVASGRLSLVPPLGLVTLLGLAVSLTGLLLAVRLSLVDLLLVTSLDGLLVTLLGLAVSSLLGLAVVAALCGHGLGSLKDLHDIGVHADG